MPETSYTGRLIHPALALGACLDAVGGYPVFFQNLWPCITSPWVYLGTDWCRSEDDMQTGMFLWVMLIAVMVLEWLFWEAILARVHWAEIPRAACDVEEKGMERKEAGGVRMRVPEKWSATPVSFQSSLLFAPLEMVVIPSRLWDLEKKLVKHARSKYAENCCAVRKLYESL